VRETIKIRSIFILKYVVGLSLIVWIISKVDRENMVNTLLYIDVVTFLIVIFFAFVNLFFQFRLWKFLVESHSHSYQLKDLLPSFFAGFAFRLMIPGGHAEITKVLLMPGRKRGKVIAFGIEKFFQTILKIILIAFALPFVFPQYQNLSWSLGVLLVLILSVLPYLLKKDRFQKIQEKKVSYYNILIMSFLNSIPIFAGMTLQYYYLLNASYEIEIFETAIVAVFLWGAGLIPISISGLGVRENLAAFFLARFAVPGAAAVGISLFVFFINMILPATVGVFIIMKRRHNLKDASGEIKKITKSIYEKGSKAIKRKNNNITSNIE
jgi:glycosyltransferase 2 family protein